MAMKSKTYRGLLKREHRILGAYLMWMALQKKGDCIAVNRGAILKFLGLQRWRGGADGMV